MAGGNTVRTNRDDDPHTVFSTDGVFKPKARDTNEAFSYTFAKAGTCSRSCLVHPRMTGRSRSGSLQIRRKQNKLVSSGVIVNQKVQRWFHWSCKVPDPDGTQSESKKSKKKKEPMKSAS